MKALLGIGVVLAVVLVPSAALAEHIRGTTGDDGLVGTPTRDWIEARDGDDLVHGRGGNDLLIGGKGDDEVRGGPGKDDVQDDLGNDVLIGGPGHDSLDGRRGNDVLIGGPGPDFVADYLGGDLIRTGAGNDWGSIDSRGARPHAPTVLHLGEGNDEILVGGPDGRRDVIDCGPGNDLAEWNLELDPQDVFIDCEVVREYEGY